MRANFLSDLRESDYIHRPLPIHTEEMREARCLQKEVLSSKLLDNDISYWKTNNQYSAIASDTTHVKSQPYSVEITVPTKLDRWTGTYGRIYAVTGATRTVDHEDWSQYNRISFWVYAHVPGYRSINFRMQFLNGGAYPVPDQYDREGHHNMNLLDGQWFFFQVEIAHMHREEVIGLSFEYDIVGHEPSASEQARFYVTDICLETLGEDAIDVYKGWVPGVHRIAFSGSGYQTGSRKVAVINEPGADHFKVVETATGKTVFTAPAQTQETSIGTFQVLDFSKLCIPGEYLIVCGETISRSFPIGEDVWEDAIWKSINFLFCERCGFEVPGKHGVCHRDATISHNGLTLIANGGWHDAGDMTQTTTMTSEMTYALFELLLKLEEGTPLYNRVLEEAKWGLDWVLKTRFGDGYRVPSSSKSCWSDGIIGNDDDVTKVAVLQPIENFMAAGAEAMGARVLQEVDPVLAAYCLKCAREDWKFAYDNLHLNGPVSNDDPNRIHTPCLLYSVGVWSAVAIYHVCKEEVYQEHAVEFARQVVACQQQTIPDWKKPLVGFFYDEPEHKLIQHYSHRSHEYEPLFALRTLYETFPDHPDAIHWLYAARLYGDYAKEAYAATAPYYVAPASIYHEDEAYHDDVLELGFLKRFITDDERREYYRRMVREGVELGEGYYLRRMPVAYAHRGNHAVTLGSGKAVAHVAALMKDYDLAELARRQCEWISGKNPFAESVMFGEGYDYCSEYAVLPGEMVGEMGVGFSSWDEEDIPYWPQVNTCVYKEVWIKCTLQWLWLASEVYGGAKFSGLAKPGAGKVVFHHQMLDKDYVFTPCQKTGWVEGMLPAGSYQVTFDSHNRQMTMLAAQNYEIYFPLVNAAMVSKQQGDQVILILNCDHEAIVALRGVNLALSKAELRLKAGEEQRVEADILDPKLPYMAVAIPGGNQRDQMIAYGRQEE